MQVFDSPPSFPRLRSRWAAVLLLGTLIASPASADVYRWVDAQGRLHFTDDAASVPAMHRQEVNLVDVAARGSRVSFVERNSSAPMASRSSSGRHVVSLERAGLQMQVRALLNDSLEARFVVDTGAMMNSIPRSLVEKLGITIDARTPRVAVSGITAETQLAPVVTLRNLKVGGAVVEQVEMVVLDTLDVGLLGMSFFNHFRIQMDPVRGTLTLEEISGQPNVGDSILDYQFSWGAVDGASRYFLEISSDDSFEHVVDETWVSGTSADLQNLDVDLTTSGTYFWRVAAVDDAGSWGPWSAPHDFRYR
jgi:clan AA aspartic protease (TIGR02281 family)